MQCALTKATCVLNRPSTAVLAFPSPRARCGRHSGCLRRCPDSYPVRPYRCAPTKRRAVSTIARDGLMQGFDHAHRGQRVGPHHADELLGSDIRNGLPRNVRHAGTHKQDFARAAAQALAQVCDLIARIDVDGLDLETPAGPHCEIMQRGPLPGPYGTLDLSQPTFRNVSAIA